MTRLRFVFYVAALTLGLSGGANASLIGDDILVEWIFPGIGDVFASDIHTVGEEIEVDCPTPPAGTSAVCDGFESPASIDIGDTFIRYEQLDSPSFAPGEFNGWVFSDLDWVDVSGEILDVELETNIDGIDPARLLVEPHAVSINLEGLGGEESFEFVELTLITRHDVPEPGTLALLGGSLLLLGAVRRRS